jgi:hypothetical protein
MHVTEQSESLNHPTDRPAYRPWPCAAGKQRADAAKRIIARTISVLKCQGAAANNLALGLLCLGLGLSVDPAAQNTAMEMKVENMTRVQRELLDSSLPAAATPEPIIEEDIEPRQRVRGIS